MSISLAFPFEKNGPNENISPQQFGPGITVYECRERAIMCATSYASDAQLITIYGNEPTDEPVFGDGKCEGWSFYFISKTVNSTFNVYANASYTIRSIYNPFLTTPAAIQQYFIDSIQAAKIIYRHDGWKILHDDGLERVEYILGINKGIFTWRMIFTLGFPAPPGPPYIQIDATSGEYLQSGYVYEEM